ncbi:2-amino-4-hydroxy-6-hydroxymethyldihydropteridine diphosphokinase [Acidithiobacillus ferriphilus]|jgi:2-amino-4-hydroxy-6-hydroxymethyldihydropteridine diphosphokinase|uniref:2-amino-4-hydroxy-6- hydroxymethyldihydropteridine diphosphokinase n=1 Tax=Acidithiobacillus ferriphilus TaxID=1689834 RepID=UPI001C610988|nr:2-amino-4-hydroxy-6-hydroxymethyldihydropteridine diphosphokinase [Acidithiobacillus ferriphilus]MBW9249175.1 2-amino-4-hydroxy-6-hydroxymethyldihydropteridine diphosphokinase [Acidithiobacillus ferriphilus]MBW9254773.1 2-amino-4-hydroxy-6-hydroxymethyldihydropteridine diphosphokinase [Acidithiobacillus ferriphilus]
MAYQTRHPAVHPTVIAWISIGSNLDLPVAQVRHALEALAAVPESTLLWQSHLYQTAPVGGITQPAFVNAVARLQTALQPRALLSHLQTLEATAGRRRADEIYWGPRVLDLDLLSYGTTHSTDPELTLPHPRLHERAFVLIPLAEFDPELIISGCGCIADHLPAVAGQSITCIPDSVWETSACNARSAQA